MSRSHRIVPTAPTEPAMSVRLGAGNAPSDNFSHTEERKIVKYVAESRYDLAVAGDEIEAVVSSVEAATQNGYSIGGVQENDMIWARADGLQATPGTGVITVGGYVVAGAITAKGTALADHPKVCLATNQATAKASPYAWRVMSLGPVGTGAVGTSIVIKRVSR